MIEKVYCTQIDGEWFVIPIEFKEEVLTILNKIELLEKSDNESCYHLIKFFHKKYIKYMVTTS